MNNEEIAAHIASVRLALLSMQRYAWEQGVAAQAFLELGDERLVILMAKEAVLRQRDDGRLGVIGNNHAVTDPAANGEPLLYAARVSGDAQLGAAAQHMVYYLLSVAPRRDDGTLYHLTTRAQVWIDSAYMAPPLLAAAGHFREAMQQFDGYRALLWNAQKKLFAHIWDDEMGGLFHPNAWGVGNGWAAAGLTRVIPMLPADMPGERARLIGYLHDVLDGCLAWQRSDGLFHNVVDDTDTFVETNLAQMLAYSIYRGVKGGWLSGSYMAAAERMRAAAHGRVDEYGIVQGVCGAPNFDRSGTAPEGQAFFLLMEAAARDIAA
jgi:unsaturated rhamnogalacturonyl hydrolase